MILCLFYRYSLDPLWLPYGTAKRMLLQYKIKLSKHGQSGYNICSPFCGRGGPTIDRDAKFFLNFSIWKLLNINPPPSLSERTPSATAAGYTAPLGVLSYRSVTGLMFTLEVNKTCHNRYNLQLPHAVSRYVKKYSCWGATSATSRVAVVLRVWMVR